MFESKRNKYRKSLIFKKIGDKKKMQSEEKKNESEEKFNPDEFETNPKFTTEEKSLSTKQLRERGKQLVSEKKWFEAFRVYTSLLTRKDASDEDLAAGLSNRSYTLYNMNNFEKAKNDGIRCVKLNPKWVKGYMRAGQAFLALNDIDKAIAYFKGGVGKEGDDGYMKKKLNEIYLDQNSPNRVLKTNYYYAELKDFKENYFSDPEKSDDIYDKLYEKKGKVYNYNELDKVLEEINQMVTQTWNFINHAELFEKENKFFIANCCYINESRIRKGENKDKMMEKIYKNFEKEEKACPNNLINNLASSRPLDYKHSIDLKTIIEIYQKYIFENYYNDKSGEIFNHYFLDDVNESEDLWSLSLNIDERSTRETFCKKKLDPKKNLDYYWKFFLMNSSSFINGAIANIIDNLCLQNIYPYFHYNNPETKQNEKVNVIYCALMDSVVVRDYKNPTLYYKNIEGYFKMLRCKTLGKPYLIADCAHSMVCLITDKIVFKKRLYLLIDLTGPQFDIFNLNENGFPYYEKMMFEGEHEVDKDFLVSSCAQKIEYHVEPMVKEDKKFEYFPLKIWATSITEIGSEIRKMLGIKKKEDQKAKNEEDNE